MKSKAILAGVFGLGLMLQAMGEQIKGAVPAVNDLVQLIIDKDASAKARGIDLQAGEPGFLERIVGYCSLGLLCGHSTEKSVDLMFRKYEKGAAEWTGLQLSFNTPKSMLNSTDIGFKTHLVIEFENLTPPTATTSQLSLMVRDNQGKQLFHFFGFYGPGKKHLVEIDVCNVGLNLAQLDTLSLGCSRPIADYKFKISRLEFQFRPKEQAEPYLDELRRIASHGTSLERKAQTDKTLDHLKMTLSKVDGPQAQAEDIKNFRTALADTKEFIDRATRDICIDEATKIMPEGLAYSVGIADSMEHVMLKEHRLHMRPADKAYVELAGNEYESFQVVVAARGKQLKNVRVEVSDLTGPGNATIKAESAVVSHSLTKKSTYPTDYVGWYPDGIVYGVNQCDAAAGDTVPFWVRLKTGANTPPGLYRGAVKITADGERAYSFPVEARVFDFTLPEASPLPGGSASATNHGMIPRTYKLSPQSKESMAARDKFFDLSSEYKLNRTPLYMGPDGFNDKLDKYDDSYYWQEKYLKRGVLKKYCMVNATVPESSDVNDPSVDARINLTLKYIDFWKSEQKKRGLLEHAYIYGFDEATSCPVMLKFFSALKKAHPDIPIATTANVISLDDPALESLDILIPLALSYADNLDFVNQLRARNKEVWWYVANFPRPPQPTLMLDVPAIVPRLLMGGMTIKYRPQGFIYWCNNNWESEKTASGLPRSNWNPSGCRGDNGEGCLFLPWETGPIPTIRIENFRDGLEDYWYCLILEAVIAKAKAAGSVDKESISEAEEALTIPEALVKDTSHYSCDPELLRAYRCEVGRQIEKLNQKLQR